MTSIYCIHFNSTHHPPFARKTIDLQFHTSDFLAILTRLALELNIQQAIWKCTLPLASLDIVNWVWHCPQSLMLPQLSAFWVALHKCPDMILLLMISCAFNSTANSISQRELKCDDRNSFYWPWQVDRTGTAGKHLLTCHMLELFSRLWFHTKAAVTQPDSTETSRSSFQHRQNRDRYGLLYATPPGKLFPVFSQKKQKKKPVEVMNNIQQWRRRNNIQLLCCKSSLQGLFLFGFLFVFVLHGMISECIIRTPAHNWLDCYNSVWGPHYLSV